MNVTMSMDEYTKLITANAEHVKQLNKMIDKYEKIGITSNDGCNYCKKEKKWLWGAWTEVRIEDGKLKTYAPEDDEIHVDEFKINYCPMCGRKLEVY